MTSPTIPVLEIGGTHVTAALVQLSGSVDHRPQDAMIIEAVRGPIPADGPATDIADAVGAVVARLDRQLRDQPFRDQQSHDHQLRHQPLRDQQGRDQTPHHQQSHDHQLRDQLWSVAIPGPFDYQRGIGLFRGVGKFAALNGVDVGRLLQQRAMITVGGFLNDADAFGLGESLAGAGAGFDPGVYLTLGTGVGSAFVRSGRCVHEGPEVPPDGHAYRITVDGLPLEDRMSRRAIRAAWHTVTGQWTDVAGLAARAGSDHRAELIFAEAYDWLARGMIDYLQAFNARVVIIGGSIAGSWWLIEKHFISSLRRLGSDVLVRPAARPDQSPLIGAAWAGAQPGSSVSRT